MTSFWIMILPLLFMVMVGLVILKIIKVLSNNLKKRWTSKHIFVVVTGYIALGLLAFLYLNFFYKPEFTALSSEEIQKLEHEVESLQKYYKEDDSSFLTENYKRESWQFEFEGDELPVVVKEGNNGFISDVRIHYTDDIEQGNVVLSYYQFPVIVEGLDMTDETPLPHAYMSNQQLVIEPGLEHSINYNRINATLSILDFNRSDRYESETIHYPYSNVFLIEVARSTNVKDILGLINFIN